MARHWADRRPSPTAHVSLDDVREWMRSGFANPQSGWNDQSETQYRLARRTCGFAARNYLVNGISCIIDDAVFPDRPAIGLGGWKRHIGPNLLTVVLLPGLDVVLARNAQRSGNRRLPDEQVAEIHSRMAGWYGSGLPIIDNSRLDVAQTAAALDNTIAQLVGRPARRRSRLQGREAADMCGSAAWARPAHHPGRSDPRLRGEPPSPSGGLVAQFLSHPSGGRCPQRPRRVQPDGANRRDPGSHLASGAWERCTRSGGAACGSVAARRGSTGRW
ncbi:hypothetical protein ACFQZC_06400 [Streptacidiphilus monticola]